MHPNLYNIYIYIYICINIYLYIYIYIPIDKQKYVLNFVNAFHKTLIHIQNVYCIHFKTFFFGWRTVSV